MLMFLAATAVQGQITISGNVYGGGNAGNLGGSTNVKIYAADITGSVYGGARQADIAGCTYVNIDGEHMSGNIIINHVYGGNDVSGIIGSLQALDPDNESETEKPDDRLDAGNHHSEGSSSGQHDDHGSLKNVSSFILTTAERKVITGTGDDAVTTQPYSIFVGSLFGSGNGDYIYTMNEDDADKWDVVVGDETIRKIDKPEVARTYVDLHGGTFGYVYAGGNNASVTTAANICVNNTSTSITKVSTKTDTDDEEGVVVKSDRLLAMGINTDYYNNDYLFSRVFGGNNKAEMKIRPSWHLANGSIEYLYSGGDEGPMTNPDGILLVVMPGKNDNLRIRNVFAGCRKAPVTPKLDGTIVIPETVDGYKFPRGLAARVLIYGGDITDVYGGNDITGKVTGGSAIGIYSSIKGCVYGGGNGSYAYTDNKNLKDSPLYGDFYYDVDNILGQAPGTFEAADATQKSFMSANALNKYRPNAEQVSLRVAGTDPAKPVIINGAIYVGGNSATLLPTDDQKANGYMIEFKIGSNVISDSVFLANNGASMVTEEILSRYASTVTYKGKSEKYSQMNFLSTASDGTDLDETGTGKNTFAKYMDGVVLEAGPQVVFDELPRDPEQYENYSTQFGSFYCGGNVGSMRNNGTTTINVDYPVVIFEKLVGGSNKAFVPASDYNVQYKGGLLGNPPTSGENAGVKLKLNLTGVKIQPKRWKNPKNKAAGLEWNTISAATGENVDPVTTLTKDAGKDYQTSTADDLDRRLKGGNVYGGCYESGRVNGNVVINVNGSIIDREGEYGVFDTVVGDTLGEAILYGHDSYQITARRSGVILDEQGMDVYGRALNLFGGGYGENSEIWGSTTINLNKGYIFQIFGGSEEGVIGKSLEAQNSSWVAVEDDQSTEDTNEQNYEYVFNNKHYAYDDHYSTTINLHGENVGASKQADLSEDLAEAEFIYGGGFEGPIIGNTRINLGNGRVFNTFAGSCNADILGHTETYIGQWTVRVGETDNTITGFPWVRDFTYGGNDLGGTIMGSKSFVSQVNADSTLAKVYGYNASSNTDPAVLTAAAYTEYKQGYVGGIFGGCYGDYDYTQGKHKVVADNDKLPYMDNAFVNISPLAASEINTGNNYIGKVFGAGQGHSGVRLGDKVQNRSYVLIDIPTDTKKFKATEVFGAGSNNGLGMRTLVPFNAEESTKDAVSAIIDLASGEINAVYGGSYNEGVTRRTLINVPAQSAIKVNNIFGGAYGTLILPPCDVYEANVNYKNTSEKATVTGAIYGGNNNERRALYTKVNISSPVWSNKGLGYTATVYGAGKGVDTWSEYTEVNLLDGANVYEVYGGGEMGHVLNAQSVQAYMQMYLQRPSLDIAKKNPKWSKPEKWTDGVVNSTLKDDATKAEWLADWKSAWTLEGYFTPSNDFSNYIENEATNFTNVTARPELDEETAALLGNPDKKFNTHVIINQGATVGGYVYGGGLGTDSIALSGDTYATTYVGLLGGTVKKDIYAAGTTGAVYDLFLAKNFTASANAYIEGGAVRNVYGGGWKGNVGLHTGANVNGKYYDVAGNTTNDVPGETNVVIGIHPDKAASIAGYGFLKGNPAIMRNAYGGGEGGAVFGTANITLRNGQIGYVHLNDGEMQDDKGAIVAAPARPAAPEEGYVYPYPERYEEKINDETYYRKQEPYDWLGEKSLEDAGCLFGGGYVDNSTVDVTNVKMYGGHIRNSLFGGGEIAAIGRGLVTVSSENISGRKLEGIYKAGKTNVWLYEGNVERNVFGGGRGYNNLGDHGSLDSDGFVFGQTEVRIYGGQVGTTTGVAKGYGNVFGGGDVGYVYSAFEKTYDDKTQLYVGIKDGERYDDHWEGYYYGYRVGEKEEGNVYGTYTPGTKPEDGDGRWDTDNGEYVLTEDCKVLVEPHAKVVNAAVTINGNEYAVGKYVPTSDLNTLSAKSGTDAAKWANLDPFGIIIHNAVFAGGNTSTGSSTAHANTPSVFGNATATIHDVYHRDLITLGTGHTGGLYGDGNLTLVDGYRGLNITNYGTDYYTIEKEITIDEYHDLPDREAAYYELKYTCLKTCVDKDGTRYNPKDPANTNSKASTITADDLLVQFLKEDPDNEGQYISLTDGESGPAILIYDEKEGWIPNPNKDEEGVPHPYWEESGVLPVYAGRLMNSIQRADFCGVFGSRMVMQGARDRVPEIVDFTNYTINRVREVSLNQQHSKIDSDLTLKEGKVPTNFPEDQDPDDFADLENAIHGNYFGIYNIVNYLGGLTSDVHFMDDKDRRKTDNIDTDTYGADYDLNYPLSVKVTGDALATLSAIGEGVSIGVNSDDIYQITVNTYETLQKVESVKGATIVGGTRLTNQTYYDWKELHKDERKRNNGTSFNKVALASGVYLELTTEKSTGKELNEKDWGYITGVIELDLINVQTGIGGGFVYAKNEHRVGTYSKSNHATLTAMNAKAITRKDFSYTHEVEGEGGVINIVDNEYKEWETSGNFVHSTQTIIDDCYNISGKYQGDDAVPAHYWYIKGSVYVYDQYISAYTGAPNAYSEAVDIPLTITAASHGTMKLLNVQPNYYAYYSSPGVVLNSGKKIIINDVTYYKNDPISYWDYYLLSPYEKELFVQDTYIVKEDCWIGDTEYKADSVLSKPLYDGIRGTGTAPVVYQKKMVDGVLTNVNVDFDFMFRSSNNLGHNTGYILTYKVNNPDKWDTWYTEKEDATHDDSKSHEKNQTGGGDYEDGPTYHLDATKITGDGTVLGQQTYKVGDIISKDIEDGHKNIENNHPSAMPDGQGEFERAYMLTEQVGSLNPGYTMSQTEKTTSYSDNTTVVPAYICTSTIHMGKNEYIYLNSKLSETEKNAYISRVESDMNAIASGASTLTKAQINASSLTVDQKVSLLNLYALRKDLNDFIQPAYYCTTAGLYGGNFYVSGINYRGLAAWSSMSKADREKFVFNYDALDLLIDTLYSRDKDGVTIHAEGEKYQYDSSAANMSGAEANEAHYSLVQPVDYTATYTGTTLTTTGVEVIGKTGSQTTINTNDGLIRTAYESLPNEQRHYTAIIVKDGKEVTEGGVKKYKVYVVNKSFQIGNTPYAVGAVLDANTYTGDMSNITTLTFPESDKDNIYYYCREKYELSDPAHPNITNIVGSGGIVSSDTSTGIDTGNVLLGTVISSSDYNNLPNDQKNFIIHGISPTETSTLFVSRESDIFDLSKEKIITVIYQYDYEETDKNGNVTPQSERHVVNIHISFKSGVPSVEDIKAPQLVLPGTKVGLREPNVTPGAYEVTGGGWELFRTVTEAESHFNGKEYSPATDSLYWYQNNWYVAYYAKTYLGKTYSNHVQVSVANYHDLKKVMEAKEHHYYIDNEYVSREPKVYINDYSKDATGSKNGLDLLKNLYDLSLLTESDVNIDEDGLITTVKDGSETPADSPFKGHKPLNNSLVGAGDNLEFILRTNVDHSSTPWNSIGSGTCFSGVLHGDGYTISGLDHSLFDKLCGQVYNLGVMGSFTGAGVAETGDGYVENCWVKTSAPNPTGTPDATMLQTGAGHYAVFGNPSRTGDTGLMQVVNCYYPESNAYTEPTGTALDHGKPKKMSDKAFYNGEVAYDLNGFYLKKRYYDNNNSWTGTKKSYNYLKAYTDGTLPDEMTEGNYPEDYACYPLEGNKKVGHYGPYGYVEDRFADGDYIYAGGVIPDATDIRVRTKTEEINNKDVEVTYYTPIWPDDYLFFGQALNYDHMDGNGGRDLRTHQDVPSHIAKSSDRIDTDVTGNRVYRAPAYFRSSEMGVAHFNPYAVFAATKKGNTAVKAYENMTAIDFTGHNDVDYAYLPEWQQWSKTSQLAQSIDKSTAEYAFYPPLLDDGGVKGFVNIDLTKNLLAYTYVATGEGHANDACNVTDATIRDNLHETPYAEGDATGEGYVAGKAAYRTVAYSDPVNIIGHWVRKSGDDYYEALRDHQLVDKQDFNAPMAYTFGSYTDDESVEHPYRMWYQRNPDNFAGQEHDMDGYGNPVFRSDAGWESISLPFAAELVTTNVKGEITHFYSSSATADSDDDSSHTKKGHEYWLREFTGIKEETKESVTTAVADFFYPTAITTDPDKTVNNTFLWDYYYKAANGHNQLDKNKDTYQTYYEASRTYTNYRQLQGATPYIIGFPGARYYEFDLSGGFEAYPTTDTYKDKLPTKLANQTITFASNPGVTIAVSDEEMTGVKKTNNGNDYYFYPNYLNIEVPEGGYVMSKDGDAFNKLAAADVTEKNNKVSAFRTYFSTATTPQRAARRIVFGGSASSLGDGGRQMSDDLTENLIIDALHGKIVVTSALRQDTDIRIFNVSGQTVDAYTLQPEQVVTTPISVSGIYIVRTADGKYLKKLFVKK